MASTGKGKKRKRDGKPPRPPNAFILFRIDYVRKHARANRSGGEASKELPSGQEGKAAEGSPSGQAGKAAEGSPSGQADKASEGTLSKRAGEAWRELSAAERKLYKRRADAAGRVHAVIYPDYKYQPERKKDKGKRDADAPPRRELVKSLMYNSERKQTDHSSEPDSESEHCNSRSSSASLDCCSSSTSTESPSTPSRDNSPVSSTRVVARSSSMPSPLSRSLHHPSEHSPVLSGYSVASDTPQSSSGSFHVKPELCMTAPSQYTDSGTNAWPIDPLNAGFNLSPGAQGSGLARPPSASSVHSAPDALAYSYSDFSVSS